MKPHVAVPAFFISAIKFPVTAFAHGGEHAVLQAEAGWDSRPLILTNLTILSILYIFGWLRIKKRTAQTGRLRLASFLLSILLLGIALVSPVATLSEELAWVHMIQHSLLLMAAAPLFILGNPAQVVLWAFSVATIRSTAPFRNRFSTLSRSVVWLSQPLLAWLLYVLVLWIWHIPALYERALTSSITHDLQHLTFFLAACLFWTVFLHPLRKRRVHPGASILYLFLASLHTVALGVFMALSPVVWYAPYQKTPLAYELDPLNDQQIAGFIMWMPACMMYMAIAVALLVVWLRQAESPPVHFRQVA